MSMSVKEALASNVPPLTRDYIQAVVDEALRAVTDQIAMARVDIDALRIELMARLDAVDRRMAANGLI